MTSAPATRVVLRDAADVMQLLEYPKERGTYHVQIYPDAASALLTLNTRPRRLDNGRVSRYADFIRRGHWQLVTTGIGIDWDGDLTQGQHRLNACVEANLPIEVFLATGLDPASRYVEDTGKPRSFHDTLTVSGIVSRATSTDAAVARLLYRYEKGTMMLGGREGVVPNDELIDFVQNVIGGDVLHDAGNAGKSLRTRIPGGNATALGAFWYLTRRCADDEVETFMARLATGAGLSENDPELTLRNLLASRRRGDPRGSSWQLAVIVKAWNARQLGRKIRYLTIRSDESQPKIIFT